MVGQVRLWMALLALFETAATFICLVPFFVADVAGSFEAHAFAVLGLAFVPLGLSLIHI